MADLKPWEEYAQQQPGSTPALKPWEEYGGTTAPEASGVIDTLKEGTKSAGRAIGSAVNTYTGNADAVVEKAAAQQEAPKDERLANFYSDVEKNSADDSEDAGVLDAVGNVGKAIWDNPAGAGLAVVEQIPNSVPTLAGGFAGMKGGAALGTAVGGPVGAAVGGIAGGLAGMFLGNTAIETGHKAMAAADDGEYTPEEMDQVKREGAIKGGVITGVDALTLGAGGRLAGAMQRTVSTAMESATRKALIDRGVDVADEASVLAARNDPAISAAVRAAQESAVKATDTLKRRAAEAGTLMSMETVGEGVGEYLGELAATGEGNVTDAVLESLLSVGQSGAETVWNMTRKRERPGMWTEAAAIADPTLDQAAPLEDPAVDTSTVQPLPSEGNPAPAPVPRPDPSNGPLSAAAAAMPAAPIAGPLADAVPAAEAVAEQPAAEATVSAEGPLADAPPMNDYAAEQPQAAAEVPATSEPVATPSQRAILTRRGVPVEQIARLSQKAAGDLIKQQNKTQQAGKPEPQQMGLQEPAAVESELREQLGYLERQAKSAGGWTAPLSRERARLRAALEQFGGEQAAKQPAADPIQGQDIDGDWMTFAEQSGTKQVPRANMPQIKAEHRGAMVNFLNARGITHQDESVPAASLKPTQGEFSRKKVEQAKAYTGGNRSILVSSDNHVLDGHHQWLAAREAGEDVKVIRLGAPIEDLLTAAAEFPSSTTAEGATTAQAPEKPAAEQVKAARKPKQEAMPTQAFKSTAGVGDILAVKERYSDDKFGVSWSSTDIASAGSMEEAAAIAKAVAESGADNITDMRAAAAKFRSAAPADQMAVKDAAPATPDAAPVKWFASESKANDFIAKKKLSATHQVVKNGSKYEIQPLAEQQGDLIVQQPPVVEPTPAAEPVVEQVEEAAKAPEPSVEAAEQDTDSQKPAVPSDAELELASRHKKIDKTLDLMDDAQITDLYARANLAGAATPVEQKRKILSQEHPDDIEPLLKPKAEPAAKAPEPETAPESTSIAVRSIRAGKQLALALEAIGFTKIEGTNGMKHVVEGAGRAATTSVRPIRTDDQIQFQVSSVTTSMQDGRMKSAAPGMTETFDSMDEAVALAAQWQEVNRKWVRDAVAPSGTAQAADTGVPIEDARKSDKLRQARKMGLDAYNAGEERTPPAWMGEGDIADAWLVGFGDGIAANLQRNMDAAKEQEKVAAPDLAQQLAGMSNAALSSLIDDIAAEDAQVADTAKPAPKRKRKTQPKAKDATPKPRSTTSPAESADETDAADVERTAGEIAKSFGYNVSSAGMEAIKGLTELFGGSGKLSSGLTFDEETYAKAKPHFQAMLRDAQAAGHDLAQFVRTVLQSFGTGVKPYIIRYANDLRDEVAQPQENTNGTDSTQPAVDRGNPAGVPGAAGGRGNDAQSGSAPADSDGVASGEPENVGEPGAGGTDDAAGLRPAKPDVDGNGRAAGAGRAGNGREGTGRAKPSDDGARADRSPSVTPTKAPAEVSPGNPGPGNFHVADPLKIVGGGQVARFDKNRAAIDLYNDLRAEGRPATREEQETLAGYTGWGSFGQELFQGSWAHPAPKSGWEARDSWLRDNLGQTEWEGLQRSITNAHYTDPPTVMAMWEMVKRMGFDGGRVLEPSMGIGNFFGMMPADLKARSQLAGIELDPVTGGMAKLLYPEANVQVKGYQDSKTPDGFYDLVIGNWPFEDTVIADRRYQRLNPYLHDYFFLKAVDQARAGGLVVGITSKGSMDKKSIGIRAELAKKAELVASFRLPSGAFKEYAGTSVVTDIVILRKRPEPVRNISDAGWIESVDYKTPSGETVSINEYYVKNPQNVIGTIDFGHGTTFKRPGMIVHRPDNMAEQLVRITAMAPEGAFQPERQAKTVSYVANHTDDRENSLIRTKDGLFVVRGEYLAPAVDVLSYKIKNEATNAQREDQLDRLITLRKQYAALIDAQRTGDAKTERKALKASYDAFVAKHGTINGSYGLKYLQRIDDPFYASLAALEIQGKDGALVPSAIMSKATTRGALNIQSPSITDAYVLARNQSINPTIEQVAELAKKPAAEVKAELLAKGAVFELPSGDVVPADIYLSGNVREKLRDAKAAVAEGLAQLQSNVAALEKVVPADVPYYKIEAQMGASWVSTGIYAEYVAHMLNLTTPDGIDVSYSNGRWKIKLPKGANNRAEASAGFGTREVPFSRLVNAAITNQTINITRKGSDGKSYNDPEATKEVNGKISEIRQRFGEWLWSDPERRSAVEREYNDARNAYATPNFDGSVLGFEGMALSLGNGPFDLRKHQMDAIWRALVMRRSLNAHEVGTGKTFTMGGIAVESRRYGIAKKPLILAHNANSKSVAAEIQMMYPAAKVLYIDNLSPDTVDIKLRQIANDDWDAVVLPHSLIDRLAFKEETLMAIAYEEIRELEIAAAEAAAEDGVDLTKEMLDDEKALEKLRSVTAKDLVKTRNKIINTIKKQAQQASREGATAFEDLGIDMVLVDEAHEFKKPPFSTQMKMKGLQTQSSNRSIALAFLTKYIRTNNAGGNVHLFTGTPITNTLTEVFHQMRYIMQEEMEAAGVDQWDGWFGSFAREVTDVELNAAAEYEAVTRLSAFINVPELRRMIGQYMDVVFADDMPEMKPRRTATGKLLSDSDLTEAERAELLNGRTEQAKDRPYKKVIVDTADLTDEQKIEFQKIQGYARAWRNMSGKERKQAMNAGDPESPIIYENLAGKASFDVRLNRGAELAGQEGRVPDTDDSKSSRVIRNVLEIYGSHPLATQVIFAQQGLSTTATKSVGPVGDKRKVTYKTFSTMRDMVERLVQQGIPREQIAIVDGSTSKDKRKAIADAMNRAEIRVVIGSSQSLGVGVNMQRNLRAMHHMDAPWMPGDLEQRNGRGHRQGNQWNTVLEYRYLTDRLDGRRWQVLAIKQRFITAFLKANDADRVIEGDAAGEEESDILETFAEAAGDPRILVREKLNKKIDQLQSRERLHGQAVSDARRSLRITRERRDEQRAKLKALDDAGVVEAVEALTKATMGAGFTMTVDGTEYDTRKDAEAAIAAFAEEHVRTGDKRQHSVGNFGGHALSLSWPQWADQPVMTVDINGTPLSSRSLRMQSLETALRGYPEEIQKQRNEVVEAARTLTRLEQVAAEPFHMAADLERAKKDYELLEKDLEQNPVPPPAWLRSGVPVDTEVTWKNKTFVVTGHRWNKDGWFVLAADAKGNVVIPYTEARDAQGMAIYEERAFEAPEVVTKDNPAGLTEADRVPEDSGVRLSRAGGRPSGATRVSYLDRRTVEQLAVEAVGEATARDRFVFTSYADLPEDVKAEATRQGAAPRTVQGLYSPKHNKTFIIDDRFTSADEAKGIMFHEHYVHFGLRAKYGLQLGPQLRQLLNGVGGLDGIRKLSREQGINLAAYERGILGNPEIAASKQPLILMEELLAHIGETTGSLRRLLEEFVGMLRAWARKARSNWFAELGVTDMAYVLREARNAAKQADRAPKGQPMFKLAGGVDQTGTDAFQRWFGDSKVVDKQGEPRVLYHGTANDFTVFENRSGNSTGHATSDLGYFMTTERSSAEGYARNASDGMPGLSKVMELYASIKNPYTATLAEMQAIENPLQARRFRAKLEQAGHDGIHIPAQKAWVAFANYQIKSATDNVGTFDDFDADIRFSLAGGFLGRREPFELTARNAKRSLKGRLADLKPALLGALPLTYMRDFAPQSMTALSAYMDEKRAMDADRNEMHTRYDAIAQRWLKLRWTDRKAEQRLADLMHSATLEGVDPSKPIKDSYTPEQKATYNRLRMQYQSLPEGHRAMFGDARDAYKQQVTTLEGVIEENIRKSAEYAKKRARRDRDADIERAKDELTGDELDEALEAADKRYNGRVASAEQGGSAKILLLRQKFESMRVDEPYFPLKRYGEYFVALRDGDELVSFSMFESAADMEAAAAELRKTYPSLDVKVGRQSNKQELEGAVDPAFIADLQDVVSRMPNSKELSDQIYQMYLETMPDFSMRKGFIHRKKTAGFDRDAMRAFASSMFHSSYQIARLKHSLEMNELVEQVEEQAKAAADPVDAMTIANELRKRHEWVMAPKGGKIAQHITSAAFVYQLGLTPAAALVNTSQTWMMGIPILGARFGSETKAMAALAKASKDFVQGRGHIEKTLEGDEALAAAEFIRMGLWDKTQSHDLAGVGDTGVEYNPLRHKVMGYISWAFHNAERYNREVTSLAAYRMARESGLDHEAAIKESVELTYTTHFDYSSGNRARYLQNDTAKVLFVFRQHSINMLARLVIDIRGAMKGETPEVKKAAKRRLAGMFSMFALFAGAMGIPGMTAILALLDLFDDEDDPWSAEDKIKRNLVEALGPDVAKVVLHGAPGTALDLSLTERIGMGSLWFWSPGRELEGKDSYLYWMEQVLGAAPAMVSNAFTGMSMIGEGHVWRGIEAMMPKAIKDVMRSGRYAQEGVQTMNGASLVDDVSTWNLISQAMGFTPAHIAERYDTNSALKTAEQHVLNERRSILNRYAMAMRQGDNETRGALLERIRSFNGRYPQYPITGKTISASLKARARREAEAEGGLTINRRLEFLRDQL